MKILATQGKAETEGMKKKNRSLIKERFTKL